MDPGGSYSRHSSSNRITQQVQILSVNTFTQKATGIMRTREYVEIDISHHVGAVQVTPATGEQWLIIKDRGVWKLDGQLPFNIPPSSSPLAEGQTRIGSSGPTELNGSLVNLNAPMRPMTADTAERPSASSVPAGSHIYDTTLHKPLWSDGTQWRDAAGSAV